ncbi:MAG: mechanosensitive ion channel [Deltaproteobacteria bacterium]|nr:mechanosensitive ion channel [Deltaproteobacteria bacterium]MBW1932904.1 mechanosensitive ion channel [Deltaproteobacteria bacterium]MBW1938572.1 mechanosensitive ion channel [Deltaproteobacteria bacterium]MBW1964136.1 mechanosensitive ion channel [Deltaproteobacteria bacterium]MBW2079920.1 mechanosensitive ion channel [Deltaproteobacteria bacterium]
MVDLERIFSLLKSNFSLEKLILILGLLLVCFISCYAIRRYLIQGLHYVFRRTEYKWDDILIEKGVFNHLAYLAPAIVLYYGVHFFSPSITESAKRIIGAYVFINIILCLGKLLTAGEAIYNTYPISKKYAIRGYVQTLKIIIYIFGLIIAISLLIDQSPWVLLSGIGAIAAVLIFVFKDTILSFVASVQILINDMVRVGDWIEMPKYGADGSVVDMALHTVKVQNWDKTITTIPTYKLIEDSFKNWRGMSDSGGRRIKRSILIDQSSIRFCDDEMIEKFKKIQILNEYVTRKKAELDAYNKKHGIDINQVVNGRRMTNMGTFRAYVIAYLRNHPKIRQDLTFLVRQLAPTPEGLPLEIYVFSNDIVWANYEAIQADIFDHILAVVSEFGLRIFQKPSGHDLERISGLDVQYKERY